jgi:hypothetical protein
VDVKFLYFLEYTRHNPRAMKAKVLTALLTALSFGAVFDVRAQATLNWHWDFDQSSYVVAPTDIIYLNATIVNDASSTVDLIHQSFMVFGIDPNYSPTPYQFTFGRTNILDFLDQFNGMDLAPGQTLQIVWGRLTPNGGPVVPGTYEFGPSNLAFEGGTTEYTGGFEVQVVPEPASFLLLFVGFACSLAVRHCGTTRKNSFAKEVPE